MNRANGVPVLDEDDSLDVETGSPLQESEATHASEDMETGGLGR